MGQVYRRIIDGMIGESRPRENNFSKDKEIDEIIFCRYFRLAFASRFSFSFLFSLFSFFREWNPKRLIESNDKPTQRFA